MAHSGSPLFHLRRCALRVGAAMLTTTSRCAAPPSADPPRCRARRTGFGASVWRESRSSSWRASSASRACSGMRSCCTRTTRTSSTLWGINGKPASYGKQTLKLNGYSESVISNGNWKVKDSNSVTKDGTIVDVFTTMTLSISGGTKDGGTYSAGHNEDNGTEVWPNSGSWTFQNGDKNKLLRSDGVAVSISVTESTLRTSFTVSGGLKDGNWVFDFIK